MDVANAGGGVRHGEYVACWQRHDIVRLPLLWMVGCQVGCRQWSGWEGKVHDGYGREGCDP